MVLMADLRVKRERTTQVCSCPIVAQDVVIRVNLFERGVRGVDVGFFSRASEPHMGPVVCCVAYPDGGWSGGAVVAERSVNI